MTRTNPEGSGRSRKSGEWAAFCYLGAFAIAVLVAMAWTAGKPELASFGRTYVPTAPGTALSLAVLALAGWFTARRPSATIRGLATVAGFIILLASGLVVAQHLWRIDLPFRPYAETVGPGGGAIIGRMSPLTALVNLLAAVTLLLLVGRKLSRVRRQSAAVFAVLLLAVSASVVISYLLKVPLFYQSPIIPMALPTAVAFTLLGLGLLGGCGSDTWPMGLISRDGPPSVRSGEFRAGYLGLGLVLLVGIAASAYEYLRHERADALSLATDTVSATADLKVRQVAAWHRERRADAATLFAAPLNTDLLRFQGNPEDRSVGSQVGEWLESLHREYGYSVAALADVDGRVLLAVPPSRSIDPDVLDAGKAAMRRNEVVIRDLHRQPTEPTVALTLLIPLPRGDPKLFLLLQADATHALFPLLAGWPTPSTSAEILLVRREGDAIVFLNGLRHRDDPPITLRLPIEQNSTLAAARALSEQESVFEGTDYRGKPVVAALRRVPGTPWLLVSKIDRTEIEASYRDQISRTALFLTILLLAVAAGVSLLWYRRSLASAERELVLTERLGRMIEANVIGIVIAGPDGRIFDANDNYRKMLGFTREEIAEGTADWRDLTPPEWKAADDRALAELQERGVCTPYEKEYIRRDGTRIPVLLADAMLPGPTPQIAAFVLDLTDRERAKADIESLARQRQLALDAALMGWWSYDPITGRISADDRSIRIFGLEHSEGTIDDALRNVHPDDLPRLQAALAAALDPVDQKPYSLEYRILHEDGSFRWVDASGIATFEGDRETRRATSLVGTLEDITARKLAETALSERVDELHRWHEATLGREKRILELKVEVNQLLALAGKPPRYNSVERGENPPQQSAAATGAPVPDRRPA